ncbi:interleukin-1 receptor type 2-like isoform X2 [Hyperolius riggenbachi]|uniref:interleukin-1 receptor type 2-like isoform X2 n=1 Tax=Hyperolius riggenbachi TaxID=752182 RepID=UPI0035A35CAC
MCLSLKMLLPLIAFGTCFFETSGFTVYRMENGEKCQTQITHPVGYFVLNEEPVIVKCPVFQYIHLDGSEANEQPFQLIWTKTGSEEINTGDGARIQTNQNALWFLPAVTGDSGTYSCILRNTSFCVEISMSLTVMSNTESSMLDIQYQQIAYENTSFQMYCPDIMEFADYSSKSLRWYKDSEALLNENARFHYEAGTTYALISDVRHDDAGYYKCQLDFSYENTDFTVSRIIHLQTIGQERKHPVIVSPSRWTFAGSIGSRLVIPCKVFTGPDESNLLVWWVANDSFVDEYSEDGRVTEGTLQKTIDTDGQYVQLSLIFERITEEDFTTNFKCIATNDHGLDVLPTQIRQAGRVHRKYLRQSLRKF